MALKCVHKGCGKVFTDPEEPCVYHPGPPEFHEGQKGWKCCKPRFLTFDEFLSIPPCTTGKHSTIEATPTPAPPPSTVSTPKSIRPVDAPSSENTNGAQSDPQLQQRAQGTGNRLPISNTIVSSASTTTTSSVLPTPPPLSLEELAAQKAKQQQEQQEAEEDSDDETTPIPNGVTCRRKTCGKTYDPGKVSREEEECIYHPGAPLFHEGSKGWTCCKRRVLEFDQFMKIEGCKTRKRHCYIGKKKKDKKGAAVGGARNASNGAANTGAGENGQANRNVHDTDEHGDDELVETVRHDFYQTATSVIVSFYLKKIDKARAKVLFLEDGKTVDLNLPTGDGKRFVSKIPLYANIDPEESSFRILGTKLELTLVKADGTSWSVLRSDQRDAGQRYQIGNAGRA